MDSAISESTTDIYLESACFDASSVRQTTSKLGVLTDSSVRYIKGTDPRLTYKALQRALDILRFMGKDLQVIG